MAKSMDVANFFIDLAKNNENDTITNLRLNKLLYFSQAWFLVRYGKPLFDETIEAWDLGPVVPSVYHQFKNYHKNNIDDVYGNYTADVFNNEELQTLLDVLNYYGQFSTPQMVNLTHMQGSPWKAVYHKGRNETITTASMEDFFKKQKPLEEFHLPTWMRENVVKAQVDDNGALVLPNGWNDDEDDEDW